MHLSVNRCECRHTRRPEALDPQEAVSLLTWVLRSTLGSCLRHRSIAVQRHHDQGNFYKRKHLIGGLFKVSEISPLSSWREHGGTHGTGAGAERYILICGQVGRQRLGLA